MKYYYNSRNTQRKQRRHVCRTFHISANLASVAISFSFVSIRTEIELLKKWMTARSRCFARKWLCGYDYQCTSVRYTTFPKPCVHTALCSEFSIFTRQNIQYFAQLCATPQENLNNPICLFRYCLYIYIYTYIAAFDDFFRGIGMPTVITPLMSALFLPFFTRDLVLGMTFASSVRFWIFYIYFRMKELTRKRVLKLLLA